MDKSVFPFCLLVWALNAPAADVRDGETSHAYPAPQAAGPVFNVDGNTITPAMGMYLAAVRDKVQRTAIREWPVDASGKPVPGQVVVRITLRKDGLIEGIQASPVADGSAPGSGDALSDAVAIRVRGAEPFAPYPASLFADHEIIVFGTTVGFARNTARPPGVPRFGADGVNKRLQLRSTIPF